MPILITSSTFLEGVVHRIYFILGLYQGKVNLGFIWVKYISALHEYGCIFAAPIKVLIVCIEP